MKFRVTESILSYAGFSETAHDTSRDYPNLQKLIDEAMNLGFKAYYQGEAEIFNMNSQRDFFPANVILFKRLEDDVIIAVYSKKTSGHALPSGYTLAICENADLDTEIAEALKKF
ncbi:hypothetical protein J4477_02450 [Candidatus Pacearchaeota archaeon]|nr:hypothetical protein [Candidatus Pacearchaeota archaeon]